MVRIMKDREDIEAELLLEVEQKGAAFEGAYNSCKERRTGSLQECIEPVARDYRDALHTFTKWILDGHYEKKPGSGAQ